MSTLALNIRMTDRLTVIIGGGAVALRKLRTLRAAGGQVRVVAMDICPEIIELNEPETFLMRVGSYTSADLDHAFLVIAATDNPLVNRQVLADAHERGILAVIADDPAAGDCTFPALLHRGDLEVAVSTSGRCPTFAVDVRDYIARYVGSDFGALLEQLAAEREKLLTNASPSTYNAQVLRSLAGRLLAELTERKEPLP